MCGIVGYIGKQQALPILLEGLARLEYRGYDSAGIAVYDQEKQALNVQKAKGRLQVLTGMLQAQPPISSTAGIGHTRWATHGAPSDVNSHPHTGQAGKIAVVHNGIIENYAQLKDFLQGKGVHFVSQTDTEVVAQLIEYFYRGDLLEAVGKALHRIQGAYALGILCRDYPDQILAVRKDSPLILGYGEDGMFLASDATAILRHTRQAAYMEDGEIAVLTREGITCYNHFMEPVEKEIVHIPWDVAAAEKGGYPHFMFKEILEQPEALRKTIFPRIQEGEVSFSDLSLSRDEIAALTKIHIVACGSSYHVGMVGKYHLEKLTRIPVEVSLASEFRYMEPIVDEKTLVIVISQSGETLDTLAALREAKGLGGRILSIVNVMGSAIARESHDVLYTWAGPEIAVATTKAYTTQLAVLNLFAIYAARVRGLLSDGENAELLEQLRQLPEKMEQVLSQGEQIQYLASRYFNHESIFFMGRNTDYAMGLEGSLKLKEISYIHSEAYAAGELKHGTISLVEEGTLVVAIATCQRLFDKAMSNVVEVKSRGAEVLALTCPEQKEKMLQTADAVITIPQTHPLLLPSLGVVPLQLFAYYVALMRGCDIDKPRNLAKSVTVE